ncbi:MAG TPA: hypothetical protein VIN00_02050 [Candidatus Dormibacteraeota bacterium]
MQARDAAMRLLNRLTVGVAFSAVAGVGLLGVLSAQTLPGTTSTASSTATTSSSTTSSSSSSSSLGSSSTPVSSSSSSGVAVSGGS